MNRALPARRIRRALFVTCAFGAAASFLYSGDALAQSIERNLPPSPSAESPNILTPNAVPANQDATPIGPALRAVVVLGANDSPAATAADGIDLTRTPRLGDDAQAFSRFLGRPISRKLIAEIEAKLARRYRAKGFPFVSISTPQQEITAGVLQVRVVEFHLGVKTASGAAAQDASYIESRVRVQPGDTIDTNELAQDLNWLNRYPFRRTEAQFTPGKAVAVTDLDLQATPLRPWSVYAGFENSGSPLTGEDRYFAGAQVMLPWLHDAVAAYQFTGSSDALFNGGDLFSSASDPRYVSHAGRLVVPTLPRQAIEASLSYVQSNEPVQDFIVRNTTYEATLDYRSALSNFWTALSGEVALGAEAKRETDRTQFGGLTVSGSSFDVFQLTLGYAQQESDAWGRTSGDLTLHVSPGSVNHHNTDAVFAKYSNGRFDEANYAYLAGDLNRYTLLPSWLRLSGWALADNLIGQYSAIPLPLTEQIGLGNSGLVRGYTLDDGAFDAGVISRNELRTPSFAILGGTGGIADQLSPYIFFDAGYGKDQRTNDSASPISTGLGADYQLAAYLTASLDVALALNTVGRTQSGSARVESRVAITF
jgi:hemolysin activation/secretion protein